MTKDPKRSSRINHQTLDTFCIEGDNIGKVIEDIRADPKLRSIVLDPSEPGASNYTIHLNVKVYDEASNEEVDKLVDIVTLMLSGGKYFGSFDPRFKSEEYEELYGKDILTVYERLKRIFTDHANPRVRKYLERATPIPGHSSTDHPSLP